MTIELKKIDSRILANPILLADELKHTRKRLENMGKTPEEVEADIKWMQEPHEYIVAE